MSARETTVLAHIEPDGTGPAALARHLGIVPSSLSLLIARLAGLGLIAASVDPGDARRRVLRLTDAGRSAVAEGSVLDADSVAAVLAILDVDARRRAVDGLALLGEAARKWRGVKENRNSGEPIE